jgi:hypothetical protein
MTDERTAILATIRAHIMSRPGLEWQNYGDAASYRAEMRGITRDRADAMQLLNAVELRDGITAEDLKYALQHNFSGRLTWDSEAQRLEYCTGQYYPTEYRAAACAVLAGALRRYWRENNTGRPGEGLYALAQSHFGRGIANRWFR